MMFEIDWGLVDFLLNCLVRCAPLTVEILSAGDPLHLQVSRFLYYCLLWCELSHLLSSYGWFQLASEEWRLVFIITRRSEESITSLWGFIELSVDPFLPFSLANRWVRRRLKPLIFAVKFSIMIELANIVLIVSRYKLGHLQILTDC